MTINSSLLYSFSTFFDLALSELKFNRCLVFLLWFINALSTAWRLLKLCISHCFFLFIQCFTCVPESWFIRAHSTDVSAVVVRLVSGKTILQDKTLLVVGGTRTQVVVDSMAFTTSAVHYTIAPSRHISLISLHILQIV